MARKNARKWVIKICDFCKKQFKKDLSQAKRTKKHYCEKKCHTRGAARDKADIKVAEKRFWEKVIKVEKGCWTWSKCRGKKGYGTFRFNDRNYQAHVFSYIIHNGPVPEGKQINHHCDNRACVKPDHIYAGTAKENTRDMMDRGRHKCNPTKGENHPNSVFTNEQILYIRSSSKKQTELGKEFGVSLGVISNIIVKRTWKHID